MQAKTQSKEAGWGDHIWNFIMEGDAMPGIMGAADKTTDQQWSQFVKKLQKEWEQDEADGIALSRLYGQGANLPWPIVIGLCNFEPRFVFTGSFNQTTMHHGNLCTLTMLDDSVAVTKHWVMSSL